MSKYSLITKPYLAQEAAWPQTGRHIMAQYDAETIVVYQAYRPEIGLFAAEHGYFGGAFSYSRMSWIKPNFLWMMYRSGWGTKAGQEITLAIRLKRDYFDAILRDAVWSSFQPDRYESKAVWQQAIAASNVRLQWDPDHAPNGAKEQRRAIQLGLRNEMLTPFKGDGLVSVTDISEFVASQRDNVRNLSALVTPSETPYRVENTAVAEHLAVDLCP